MAFKKKVIVEIKTETPKKEVKKETPKIVLPELDPSIPENKQRWLRQ